ncbi:hypothetical protein A4R44_03826 [Amycolatopsis sp. M39]|nr:hypothetical protein A4R44_03826 [Amycolatopsis sp. M39]
MPPRYLRGTRFAQPRFTRPAVWVPGAARSPRGNPVAGQRNSAGHAREHDACAAAAGHPARRPGRAKTDSSSPGRDHPNPLRPGKYRHQPTPPRPPKPTQARQKPTPAPPATTTQTHSGPRHDHPNPLRPGKSQHQPTPPRPPKPTQAGPPADSRDCLRSLDVPAGTGPPLSGTAVSCPAKGFGRRSTTRSRPVESCPSALRRSRATNPSLRRPATEFPRLGTTARRTRRHRTTAPRADRADDRGDFEDRAAQFGVAHRAGSAGDDAGPRQGWPRAR